jgi:rfaE bifunctional protein kinase chain/domain
MNALARHIEAFSEQRLVVLGDLVADEYVSGTTSRISREAPVLIVREEHRALRPGAAANAVANLRALGGAPLPVGLVGDDADGAALLRDLQQRGIDCRGIVSARGRRTARKTRILAGGRNTVRQQMLRLDRLAAQPDAGLRGELVTRLRAALDGAAGLVVSDYGEGVVTDEVFAAVLAAARDGVAVYVDSRFRIADFHGVAALTPNEPELAAATGIELDGLAAVECAGRSLLERTGAAAALIKRGRAGMALLLQGADLVPLPAFGSSEIADVTGAGDTVLAAWSLARAAGAAPFDAMRLANIAGGLQVTKAGTAVVTGEELSTAIDRDVMP